MFIQKIVLVIVMHELVALKAPEGRRLWRALVVVGQLLSDLIQTDVAAPYPSLFLHRDLSTLASKIKQLLKASRYIEKDMGY